jgi:hypothetical protein
MTSPAIPWARWSSDPCTRGLVAACVLVGGLSMIFILDYTGYPFAPYLFLIAEYFLRTQDLAGSVLLIALAVAAYFSPTRSAALGFVDAVSRHPWRTAAITFVVLCIGTLFIEHNHPLAQDEYAALFQSRVFAAGRLTGQFPPDLIGHLVAPRYFNQFLYASFKTGQVASAYWPGFALLLTPFSFLHVPWACNPLLASLSLVLMARLAARLSGEPQAGGWAMLLALGSPGFTGMSISYFSMPAHLLFNLVFAWLLLERTKPRLLAAGFVGSFALILHNPLPHALFALPWIVSIARGPQRYRNLLVLGAGYLVFALPFGFGWPLLLSGIQGHTSYGLYAADTTDPVHRVMDFFWNWHIRLRSAIHLPNFLILTERTAELTRLWSWAVPGLPLLAAAGWWLGRRDQRIRLLGLSILATLAGYMFVWFSQGNGWGARYLHPAWGVLPVLAAVALVRVRPGGLCARLPGYVASLAVLSLVFATGLRAAQISGYIETQLANRPPVLPDARQIVFVHIDLQGYTADLIQNDPFLRDKVWFMASYGPKSDAELMRRRFPAARLVTRDGRGETYRLDSRSGQPVEQMHGPSLTRFPSDASK